MRLKCFFLLLTVSTLSHAQTGAMSDLPWFYETGLSPENNLVYLRNQYTEVPHVNDYHGVPISFPGYVEPTSCNDFFDPEYISCVTWPPVEALVQIQELCSQNHHYSSGNGSLTTALRFDYFQYHVCQYDQQLTSPDDTMYTTPWQTKLLPSPEESQCIWIEGVSRISGVVEGQVTVLSGDSLFIMDNLYTADTNLETCNDPEVFGMIPEGSTNCIGLISENNIILAATVPNGLGNSQGIGLCSPGISSNVISCQQEHRDVIVTASVLALSCVFESEFWKTTVSEREIIEGTSQPMACGGQNNLESNFLDCANTGELDHRGTLWFCGSLGASIYGYMLRTPVGPWGEAIIGYDQSYYRYDHNLLNNAPPLWPPLEFEADPIPLNYELNTGASSACGEILSSDAFLEDWNSGEVWLRVNSQQEYRGQIEIRLQGNGHDLEIFQATLGYQDTLVHAMPANLWFSENEEIILDLQLALIPWNGEEWVTPVCQWDYNPTVEVISTPQPQTVFLPAYPNPFNPVTQIPFHLEYNGPVQIQIYNLQGQLVRELLNQSMTAGDHKVLFDAKTLTSGVYITQLKTPSTQKHQKILLLK